MSMRLKVDNRIRVVLENGAATGHRSLVVLVGEKSKDQVVFIHNLLSNTCLQQASVIWCYKKELSLSSNRKKRFKQIQAAMKTGQFEPNEDDLFEKFVSTTTIKYCYYKDTFKVLGNTFKMCVLQDFEGVTANTLCRVIETVEGGGAVVLLLQSVDSLKQLYTMCMDVHARYRTHAHHHIVPRFNERLLQSLSSCPSCIIIDDQLRVVQHSTHMADVTAVDYSLSSTFDSKENKQLVALKKSMKDTPPMGNLVDLCKTLDQAKVLLKFSLCITEKLLSTTVSLTAARGRGKSAAMGLAIAGAIAFGYANIYVTSPSPENLVTLFDFLERGLQCLGYEEMLHYNVERSSNEDLHKCVTRVRVTRDRRQVVQYISPDQCEVLTQAELLVIDEAAAIPLPLVRGLMGPYLVFLSSTVSGYEGTGRSLALKLIAELRTNSEEDSKNRDTKSKTSSKRKLVELTLEESIRYRPGDPVESWLTSLLCLEPTLPELPSPLPPPDQCQLYHVNRDTLFGYHKVSEQFLSLVQSLLVSSHYRNSPDDLQQLSDAPAHHLFVLLPPHDPAADALPPVLVVMQVVLEGGISRAFTITGLSTSDGDRPAGDLIPWTVGNAFQNYDFPRFSGARVLRIATHPHAQGRQFGSRALRLLRDYYATNAHLASCKEVAEATLDEGRAAVNIVKSGELSSIGSSKGGPDAAPLLLCPLAERPAEAVHYLGAAFGVTQPLLAFWKRAGYSLVYISNVNNRLTGEHTVIMLDQLCRGEGEVDWLRALWEHCKERLVILMGSCLRHMSCQFALSALNSPVYKKASKGNLTSVRRSMSSVSADDVSRLSAFIRHQCEALLISDLVAKVARLYFTGHIENCKLKTLQMGVLCGLGLQYKSEATLAREFGLPIGAIFDQKKSLLTTLHTALGAMLDKEEEAEEEEVEEESEEMCEEESSDMKKVGEEVQEEIGRTTSTDVETHAFVRRKVQEKRKADERLARGSKKVKKLDLDTLRNQKRLL